MIIFTINIVFSMFYPFINIFDDKKSNLSRDKKVIWTVFITNTLIILALFFMKSLNFNFFWPENNIFWLLYIFHSDHNQLSNTLIYPKHHQFFCNDRKLSKNDYLYFQFQYSEKSNRFNISRFNHKTKFVWSFQNRCAYNSNLIIILFLTIQKFYSEILNRDNCKIIKIFILIVILTASYPHCSEQIILLSNVSKNNS